MTTHNSILQLSALSLYPSVKKPLTWCPPGLGVGVVCTGGKQEEENAFGGRPAGDGAYERLEEVAAGR
jgi:hypothetical protein